MRPDQSMERENRRSISWYSMVRPGSEVELSQLERFSFLSSNILRTRSHGYPNNDYRYEVHDITYSENKFSDGVVC